MVTRPRWQIFRSVRFQKVVQHKQDRGRGEISNRS